MLRPILTIVVILIALSHATPALADIFRLINRRGAYLPYVAYEVRNAAGQRVARGATDGYGRFVVSHAPGSYRLVIHLRGRSVTAPIRLDGRGNLKRVPVPVN